MKDTNVDTAERPDSSGITTESDFTSFPQGPDDGMCALPPQTDSKEWIRDHLRAHIAWSLKTFGPGPRPVGLVKHIEKELLEIQKAPDDLEEWIDVIILAIDGATRCGPGHTPDEVLDMLEFKQKKNFSRVFVAKGPDEPNEHVREGV